MSGFHLIPEAESELDEIWLYIARESNSASAASRFIDSITDRFWLLARHPRIGRGAIAICAQAYAVFQWEST